ncbi:alpha-ketoglutarate-dependent dioxygenase AlkB family protein [Flavobacterium tegetincola]|uniref:alpha-ketoglutarate-dependent dioxygenase AlkB family protein n=1 Tax=Flavobacterium tegetincola TaxID=150172 RepID=UPI0004122F9A|nr:alpha-ketoglutarate-dependent dioxygenase AlkB [Flavobacterium tegetincola]
MSQLDMFGEETPNNGDSTVLQNGEYIYIPNFLGTKTADRYLEAFKNNIEWQQQSMNMYGKQVLFPRLTSWYGENDKAYSFSGITLNPHAWSEELLQIKSLIEPISEVEFNSVLLNRYRDGNDSISWHTDAEKELGRNPIIASVNFGAERKFQLKHNDTQEKHEIVLKHGSLLLMKGELQHFWKHQVPKQKNITKERINLTFRVIK